jgi:hypothetical protein
MVRIELFRVKAVTSKQRPKGKMLHLLEALASAATAIKTFISAALARAASNVTTQITGKNLKQGSGRTKHQSR